MDAAHVAHHPRGQAYSANMLATNKRKEGYREAGLESGTEVRLSLARSISILNLLMEIYRLYSSLRSHKFSVIWRHDRAQTAAHCSHGVTFPHVPTSRAAALCCGHSTLRMLDSAFAYPISSDLRHTSPRPNLAYICS